MIQRKARKWGIPEGRQVNILFYGAVDYESVSIEEYFEKEMYKNKDVLKAWLI